MAEQEKKPPRLTDLSTCGGCAAKVPPDELKRIIGGLGFAGASAAVAKQAARDGQVPHVLVGTETGDDAAVVQVRDDLALVMTTDFIPPVCDDPYLYGQIAAANAISDVFAMGGTPTAALAVCAFPEALDVGVAHEILAGATATALAADCPVLGGHTVRNAELLFGLAVTGTVHPKKIIRNQGACPGDALILTKPLGTGIIINAVRSGALSFADALPILRAMSRLNQDASLVMQQWGAHAATDVTGFGLAGHALGMARASGVNLRIHVAALPLYDHALRLQQDGVKTKATRSNRETYAANVQAASGGMAVAGGFAGALPGALEARAAIVYDAQTSGGLLLAVAARDAEAMVGQLHARGVDAACVIGEVCAPGQNDGQPTITLV